MATLPPLNRVAIRRHLGLSPLDGNAIETYIESVEDGGDLQTDAAAAIAAADTALLASMSAAAYEDIDIIKAKDAVFDPTIKISMAREAYTLAVRNLARTLGLSFLAPSGTGTLTGFSMQ